jgi:hypothetical protein
LADIIYLKIKNKLALSDYFVMGLYRSKYGSVYKYNVLGEDLWREIVVTINPLVNRILLNHKLITKLLLEYFHISVPRTIGLLRPGRASSKYYECFHGIQDLIERMKLLGINSAVIKPVCNSRGGQGIKFMFLDKAPIGIAPHVWDKYYMDPNCIDSDLSKYLDINEEYLCEEYVAQHSTLSRLNPYALNTVRVLCLKRNGSIDVVGAFIKVSKGTMPIDNFGAGGIVAKIDLANGAVGSFYNHELFYEEHNNLDIDDGLIIPHFDKVLHISQKTAMAIYGLDFIGIDVAVTNNGPVVIEANAYPSYESQFILETGFRNILNPLLSK